MLFAEIHRKLSLDDDNERREDVLTSTVFGTLIVGEKWSLLAAWFGAARDHNGKRLNLPPVTTASYWFWPRLFDGDAIVEPDLLLLFGDVLVIVEAKYLSGKSSEGSADDGEIDPADQLTKEWRSCDPMQCDNYPVALRDAILHGGAKRVLIYLVRQPASAKTRRELDESRRGIGEQAALHCLGWSDLCAVLRHQAHGIAGWTAALAELLERRGFTSFSGFPSINSGNVTVLDRARTWRIRGAQLRDRRVSFPRVLSEVPIEAVRRLALSPARTRQSESRWSKIMPIEKLELIRGLLGRLRDRGGEEGT